MLPPLIQSLQDPSVYPHRPASVEMLQTHISYIFLAGDVVYKVKKPVDLDFLDFTTLEKRRHYCFREVELNRRLAPDVYLGVVEIASGEGRIRVEGAGQVEEYAVKMRRLPGERMMDLMLARGEVDRSHIDAIIAVLVPFFENAEHGPEIESYGSAESVKFNTDENFSETRDFVSTILAEERYRDIERFTNRFLENRALFERRIQEGKIRDCHGDLHSANICLADDVVIYDCIEFNRRFRYQDIAADVAFLAMDLDFRGSADLANYLAREFSRRSGDRDLLLMLPFYKCYRAYVRGKVNGFAVSQSEQSSEDRVKDLRIARRYFALAHRYTGAYHRPKVMVMFGLSGTGKSTVAEKLGRELGWPVLNTDRVRKDLAGIGTLERRGDAFGKGLYSPEMTQRTYREMVDRAGAFLEEGQSVILDGVFGKGEERIMVAEMARRMDAEPYFLLCECPEDMVRDRILARTMENDSVSDADFAIYLKQRDFFDIAGLESLENYIPIDTSEPAEVVAHELAERFV
jgi:uncharacterized protein